MVEAVCHGISFSVPRTPVGVGPPHTHPLSHARSRWRICRGLSTNIDRLAQRDGQGISPIGHEMGSLSCSPHLPTHFPKVSRMSWRIFASMMQGVLWLLPKLAVSVPLPEITHTARGGFTSGRPSGCVDWIRSLLRGIRSGMCTRISSSMGYHACTGATSTSSACWCVCASTLLISFHGGLAYSLENHNFLGCEQALALYVSQSPMDSN